MTEPTYYRSFGVPLPEPKPRYGIIPCRRCAFFEKAPEVPAGACCLHPMPVVKGEESGCGDGLLREEAAPLPPEREPEQEPKP